MKLEELPLLDIFNSLRSAQGNFDQERVDNTKAWIEQLQQSVRYYAWLNPMPSECWRQTTAGEIARFVAMFEMSSQGMNAVISVLRGRHIVVKELENLYAFRVKTIEDSTGTATVT
jgi:uncharacterized protein